MKIKYLFHMLLGICATSNTMSTQSTGPEDPINRIAAEFGGLLGARGEGLESLAHTVYSVTRRLNCLATKEIIWSNGPTGLDNLSVEELLLHPLHAALLPQGTSTSEFLWLNLLNAGRETIVLNLHGRALNGIRNVGEIPVGSRLNYVLSRIAEGKVVRESGAIEDYSLDVLRQKLWQSVKSTRIPLKELRVNAALEAFNLTEIRLKAMTASSKSTIVSLSDKNISSPNGFGIIRLCIPDINAGPIPDWIRARWSGWGTSTRSWTTTLMSMFGVDTNLCVSDQPLISAALLNTYEYLQTCLNESLAYLHEEPFLLASYSDDGYLDSVNTRESLLPDEFHRDKLAYYAGSTESTEYTEIPTELNQHIIRQLGIRQSGFMVRYSLHPWARELLRYRQNMSRVESIISRYGEAWTASLPEILPLLDRMDRVGFEIEHGTIRYRSKGLQEVDGLHYDYTTLFQAADSGLNFQKLSFEQNAQGAWEFLVELDSEIPETVLSPFSGIGA